ncbi:protein embryo defective 1674 [Fagus crenata]
MASGSGLNQSDDGSSSYFQKTVCLQDWWLIKAKNDFQGKRLGVAGSSLIEKQAVRVFSSAPIVERYGPVKVETADGIFVIIRGPINKLRTQDNGFPSTVVSHFIMGFPTDWDEYVAKFLEDDSTTVDLSGITSDSEYAAVAGKKNFSPTSEQTPNNHEQVIHRGNLKNNPGSRCSMRRKIKKLSPASETFDNPDRMKLNSSRASTKSKGIMDISDNVPDHSMGQGNLSDNVRSKRKGEKRAVGGLKSESNKMNSVPVASDNLSKILQNDNCEFEGNGISTPSADEGKKDAKEGTCRKKTKRNLFFDLHASPHTEEGNMKKNIVSPESLSSGRSRSGRLLVPTLEFWRNQVAVYDADRKITGIMNGLPDIVPSEGVRSKPQKRQRQ